MSKINLHVFKSFFSSQSAGGVLLIFCVVISLMIANSPLAGGFDELLKTEIGSNFSGITLRYPVLLWINDGLMAIFFLLVGLEIKRELVEGELSSFRQAALPVFAAIGGMAVPALIFALFNNNTETANGWGIPMATDIAFAIAILSLLGDKVPTGLKVFLTALAIVDDLGAILVIALFYSAELHLTYLLYAGGILLLLVIFNRLNLSHPLFYVIPGLFIWYFIHHSGIHATIAGVLTAFTLPTTPDDKESPLEKLEHWLTRPVNFLIMPLFALANTNIHLDISMVGGIFSNMGLGILLGLFLGKPIGIFIMSWVAVKSGIGGLPEQTKWNQLVAAGVLAGIGFTMSIFIAMLSYSDHHLQIEAKFVILVTSVLAGIIGYSWLKRIKFN
ncbi:Na+/H+ antiporter NhaA [Pararcticibacter amylolyticus]|uniref:Na(+)/H(+) antiporter NhaA n=1 Tax=Pararcticibacter amylolyticus TaxID=2173175 RepID=A0A2U2PII2_9SPHI|nr:Na+/H+ antiporter NhaA [Pararcticibacter amylolyticus]PWG81216.1 Na+/H+ antiporter NhaA [Pararcticibacter amylolyticus]